MTDKVETIAKAAAIGGLICVSPVVSGTIIGVNVIARHVIDDKVQGRDRVVAFAGMNAVLCLAAGAVSVFYSWVPAALVAAGALTYLFGRDVPPRSVLDAATERKLHDISGRTDGVVIDAEIVG